MMYFYIIEMVTGREKNSIMYKLFCLDDPQRYRFVVGFLTLQPF